MATFCVTSSFQSNVDFVILKDVRRPITDIQLGKGAYGKVFEVQYAGMTCAAKEIHPIFFRVAQPEELDRIKKNFLQECRIWSTLHHPKIVTLIGVYFSDEGNATDIPIMVMEKMDCSLRSLIERDESIELNLRLKISILYDISVGLWHLHNQNPPIIHRDLTPNNVLLRKANQCYEAKISDLGVSKVIENTDSGRTMTKAPGTQDFMPPETLDDNPKYNTAVDIFSYAGIILYTIVQEWPSPTAREKNNPNTGKRELVCEVERRQRYLDKMKGFEKDLKPLAILCLDDYPKQRPIISEISTTVEKVMKDAGINDGFDSLQPTLPAIQLKPSDIQVS